MVCWLNVLFFRRKGPREAWLENKAQATPALPLFHPLLSRLIWTSLSTIIVEDFERNYESAHSEISFNRMASMTRFVLNTMIGSFVRPHQVIQASRGRTHDVSSSSSLHSLGMTTMSRHPNCLMVRIMVKRIHEDPMLRPGWAADAGTCTRERTSVVGRPQRDFISDYSSRIFLANSSVIYNVERDATPPELHRW
jgi:hypothetical protein